MKNNMRWDMVGLVACLLWVLGWYWPTVAGMVDVWLRSDTFAHGVIVPVISAWLIWRDRNWLLLHEFRPSVWAMLLVIPITIMWLLSQLASANSPSQFALIALLVLVVPVLAGWRVTRRVLFPLAFLFFAVPMGEFLLPVLMENTADFTVAALKLTGIPVYREGQFMVIPSGSWSVVEACSGIRYLIASLMVGTLYAYLNYHAWWRKLVFTLVSALLPLVANWIRAYLIVMMGHLSDNRLAAGVDHLIYGWIFFGFVMALMFWIGSLWHEPHLEPKAVSRDDDAVLAAHVPTRFYVLLPVLMALLVAPIWGLQHLKAMDQQVASHSHAQLPEPQLPGWSAMLGGLTTWKAKYQNPNAELQRVYQQGPYQFAVYVAYYRDQSSTHKLISSDNMLVSNFQSPWLRTATGQADAEFSGKRVHVLTTDLFSMSLDQRLVIWQWYWVAGYMTSNELLAKAYTAIVKALGQRDDSAVIMVYAFKNTVSEQGLPQFVAQVGPALEQMLVSAGGQP